MSILFMVCFVNSAIAAVLVPNKLDRYIIACHTTDFECFKRQYQALRDHVLLGNKLLDIPRHHPFTFLYGDTATCVQLTGVEKSELIGISFDTNNKEFSMVLQLPLKISQVKKHLNKCAAPDRKFPLPVTPHEGPMKWFTGNATIQVTYPIRLNKKNGEVYLELKEEDVDFLLDIPDLTNFDSAREVELRLYQWSEWAYDVVQYIDPAQRFAIPYTSRMRTMMEKIPLKSLILLYPEENYVNLNFIFTAALQS